MNNKITYGIVGGLTILLIIVGMLMMNKSSTIIDEPDVNITLIDNVIDDKIVIVEDIVEEQEEQDIDDITIEIPDDLNKLELEDILNEDDKELIKILESLNK